MADLLVIEDGTIVTGANSYVTRSYVDTFCSALGLTAWAALSTSSRESAILRGMAYIESLAFKGVKSFQDQPVKWPRDGVFDEDGYAIDDWIIPENLKRGLSRAAYEESISPGTLQTAREGGIKREKVDVLEVEYFTDSGAVKKIYETISGYLAGLLRTDFAANVTRT